MYFFNLGGNVLVRAAGSSSVALCRGEIHYDLISSYLSVYFPIFRKQWMRLQVRRKKQKKKAPRTTNAFRNAPAAGVTAQFRGWKATSITAPGVTATAPSANLSLRGSAWQLHALRYFASSVKGRSCVRSISENCATCDWATPWCYRTTLWLATQHAMCTEIWDAWTSDSCAQMSKVGTLEGEGGQGWRQRGRKEARKLQGARAKMRLEIRLWRPNLSR